MFYNTAGTIIGFVLAYGVTAFGDFMYPALFEWKYTASAVWALAGWLVLAVSVSAFVVLFNDTIFSGSAILSEAVKEVQPYIVMIMLCLACLPYGVIARPFTNFGANPVLWVTPWSLIPLSVLSVLVLKLALNIDARNERIASHRKENEVSQTNEADNASSAQQPE